MEKRILVMLSGGLDSTYTLWHYLTKTPYDVHVHHIVYKAHYSPWLHAAESLAVSKIIAWCWENIRDFEYSESTIDLGFGHVLINTVFFVMSQLGMALAPKQIQPATGMCKEDFSAERRRQLGTLERNIYSAAINCNMGWNMAPESEEPGCHLTKADMLMEMPAELTALTWSCRRPRRSLKDFKRCGRCHACRHLKQAWEVIDGKGTNH